MATVPKLQVPFAISGTKAKVVEQDSAAEIEQCLFALFGTEVGSRVEEPDYGIVDPTLAERGVDPEALRAAADNWEPRAEELLTESHFEGLIQKVTVIANP